MIRVKEGSNVTSENESMLRHIATTTQGVAVFGFEMRTHEDDIVEGARHVA